MSEQTRRRPAAPDFTLEKNTQVARAEERPGGNAKHTSKSVFLDVRGRRSRERGHRKRRPRLNGKNIPRRTRRKRRPRFINQKGEGIPIKRVKKDIRSTFEAERTDKDIRRIIERKCPDIPRRPRRGRRRGRRRNITAMPGTPGGVNRRGALVPGATPGVGRRGEPAPGTPAHVSRRGVPTPGTPS